MLKDIHIHIYTYITFICIETRLDAWDSPTHGRAGERAGLRTGHPRVLGGRVRERAHIGSRAGGSTKLRKSSKVANV